MTPLREAALLEHTPGRVSLALAGGWQARVELLPGGVGRYSLLPPDGRREPRTWALDPSGQFPVQGLPREGLFEPDASASFTHEGAHIMLAGALLRARITLAPSLTVTWEQALPDGRWVLACGDRDSYALATSARTGQINHWQVRDAHDRYFGLGDKTGPVNLQGRRLRTRQVDALGYDAQTGDPLYKQWPFLLNHRADTATACGIYYDTLAECTFDLGAEHDNYHGRYRATEIADGDLDMYVFAGPTLDAALARFVAAIGGTALPPRWSLGYANTAMALADHPDAQQRIRGFLAQAEAEQFPMSSFHFGSGYTSRGKQRYVFTWNRDKFPDPPGLLGAFAQAGVRTVANIKPCLLNDHPAYAGLQASGAFVRDDNGPCLEQFWDGWGAHLDFTRTADAQWWQQQFRQQVLDVGIDAGWNDNNEYEIWGDQARANGFGHSLPLPRSRALQALLMTRATFDEQARAKPDERVYTITRGGPPGLQRYAQTWTGDNTTSWHTLRWNQRMALTMGLSGLFNVGHDIGGFDGPVPDAELLTRWTQACCLVPRMIMNSWKADGSVNSPWLHPEATAPIRQAIALRLKLMPYLYTQMWRASTQHRPVLRPTFFDFGHDAQTWHDSDEMMVGPDLLVAPVFEPGARQRRLYLPQHAGGWYDWATGAHHAGGQWITVEAPLQGPGSLPLFVRGGAVLPTTDANDDLAKTEEPSRALLWFPAPGDAAPEVTWLYEDDGLQPDPSATHHVLHQLSTRSDAGQLHLHLRSQGQWALPYAQVRIQLPAGEARAISLQSDHPAVALVK